MYKIYICIGILLLASYTPTRTHTHTRTITVTHAKWDGERFMCARGDLWASEPEAIAGKDDFVYCVEATR